MWSLAKLGLWIALIWGGGTLYQHADDRWQALMALAFLLALIAGVLLAGMWAAGKTGWPRSVGIVLAIVFPLGLMALPARKRRPKD